jgi:hypothetical protein
VYGGPRRADRVRQVGGVMTWLAEHVTGLAWFCAGWALLIVATAGVLLARWYRRDRADAAEIDRQMETASFRQDNVTYLDGYTYAPTRPMKPGGGGTDDASRLGVVRGAVAGGNGPSDPTTGSSTSTGGINA